MTQAPFRSGAMGRHRVLIDSAALGAVGGVLIVAFGQPAQIVALAALGLAAVLANGRLGAFVGGAGAVSAVIFRVASLTCADGPGQNCAMDAGTATLIGISIVLAIAGGVVAAVWARPLRT